MSEHSVAIEAEVPNDSPAVNQSWFDNDATPEAEQQWSAERAAQLEADRLFKQQLGQEPGRWQEYKGQLEALSSDERAELVHMDADELIGHLEGLKKAGRDLEKAQKAARVKAAEDIEARFALHEMPQAGETRRAMKRAFDEATSLDARIAELRQLNEIRQDPSDPRWDNVDNTAAWIAARNGDTVDLSPELQALVAEKSAKLQEVAIHQAAYTQIAQQNPAAAHPESAAPTDPQRIAVDHQLFKERAVRYLAANQGSIGADMQRAMEAGLAATRGQGLYIQSLGNGPAVIHELCRDHATFRKLIAAGDSPKARRIIDSVSARLNDDEPAPRGKTPTSAPRPPSPVGGGSSRVYDTSDPNTTDEDEWVRERNKERARKGKF